MASLGRGTGDGDAAPPLAAWPGDLLATAPSLRVLRCVGALSPAAPPAGIPLRPFAGLVRLTLAGCALPSEAIDWGGLAVLTRLTRLSLRDNALRTLPLALGDLPALQELDLANNQLETLPSSALPGWLSLTVLNVSCNRLKALPPELGSCAALEVLAAQGNQLEELPRQLAALQSLKILTLEGNRIRSVPPTILTNCVALCTLGLHDNPITVEELRETEGWASYDARRRAKYDKQLESSVLGSSMDEGADAHPVQNWK